MDTRQEKHDQLRQEARDHHQAERDQHKPRTLQEYMDILGHSTPSLLAFSCHVPEPVIQRVLAGQEISVKHANNIHRYLVGEFGHGFELEHIKGLKTC